MKPWLFRILLTLVFACPSAFGAIEVIRLPDLPRNFCALGEVSGEGYIERYAIRYQTEDKDGRALIASGLVAFRGQLANTELTPILYMHPTASHRNDVPSAGSFESKFAACRLLNSKRIMIAPDFPGLGSGEGTHPYMIRESINLSTRDFLDVVYHWFSRRNLSKKINIVGYSQGGHAALSLLHYLEDGNSEYSVDKTFAMSAPLDLQGGMLDHLMYREPQENTGAFTALILVNYQDYYGDIYRVSPFVAKFEAAENLAQQSDKASLMDFLPQDPDQFLDSSFYSSLKKDSDHPLRERLRENDMSVWKSSSRIYLGYSDGDKTVPSSQAKAYYQKMSAMGNRVYLMKTAIILGHSANFIRSIKVVANNLK